MLLDGNALTQSGALAFFAIGGILGLLLGILGALTAVSLIEGGLPRKGVWISVGCAVFAALIVVPSALAVLIAISNFPFPRSWFS